MKKKIILCLIVLSFILILIYLFNYKGDANNLDNNKNYLENDIGMIENNDIYDVEENKYDGSEIFTIKPSVKFKVAFAGLIKGSDIKKEEIDEIYNNYYPRKKGIWIENSSKVKVLECLDNKDIFKSEYLIDDDGYLIIKNNNEKNNNDNMLQNAINSEKQYIICISSICYIIDDVTGEILDYSFEKMDEYQTYEYFEDGNRQLIFITENKNKKLTNNEIVESVLRVF